MWASSASALLHTFQLMAKTCHLQYYMSSRTQTASAGMRQLLRTVNSRICSNLFAKLNSVIEITAPHKSSECFNKSREAILSGMTYFAITQSTGITPFLISREGITYFLYSEQVQKLVCNHPINTCNTLAIPCQPHTSFAWANTSI